MSRTRKRAPSASAATNTPIKKRKTNTSTVSSFTRLATGPLTLVRKLRYATHVVFNPAAGAAQNIFIKANGLFDPEVAVGGHQPLGFDQYMLFYDHFRVDSSHITCYFQPTTANVVSQSICAISLDDDTVANTSSVNMIEQGLATWKIGNVGAGNEIVTLRKSFNLKKFFRNQSSAFTTVGNAFTDPSELANFNISVGPMDGVSDVEETKCFIVVDYIVTFSERKTLAQS